MSFALIFLTFPVYAEYQAGDHELFLMPTAYTMPKGSSYFTDYEVAIINYTYALTSRTHIGVFSFFPINKDVLETTTLGIKQNYYSSENTGCAFWSAYIPKSRVLNLGNVLSLGKKNKSFHFAVSVTHFFKDFDIIDSADTSTVYSDTKTVKKWAYTCTAGYRKDLSEKISLIAEYSYVFAPEEGEDADFLAVGPRFRTKKIDWDIAAARPIIHDAPGLIVFPVLKATIIF